MPREFEEFQGNKKGKPVVYQVPWTLRVLLLPLAAWSFLTCLPEDPLSQEGQPPAPVKIHKTLVCCLAHEITKHNKQLTNLSSPFTNSTQNLHKCL